MDLTDLSIPGVDLTSMTPRELAEFQAGLAVLAGDRERADQIVADFNALEQDGASSSKLEAVERGGNGTLEY